MGTDWKKGGKFKLIYRENEGVLSVKMENSVEKVLDTIYWGCFRRGKKYKILAKY